VFDFFQILTKMEGEIIYGPHFDFQLECNMVVAYLSLGMYRHRNEVFWNSEVGWVAMTHHLENMKPNKEGQVGVQRREADDSEKGGAPH